MYQFDEMIDRRSTYAKKWDPETLQTMFNNPDALPMWIADMDFRVAPEITEAIQQVVDHGIYGYSNADSAIDSYIHWVQQTQSWQIQSDWVTNTPGVVTALNLAIQAFTDEGDSVLIHQPVYYPFMRVIENNGRHIVTSELNFETNDIQINFDDFKEKVSRPEVKLFILCSPHNPLGHLYSKEALTKMLDLCIENDVMIVADEIHGDLIMPGEAFVSVGALGEDYLSKTVIMQAPSKSFNLAGMQWSAVVIRDKTLRKKFRQQMGKLDLAIHNPLAIAAVESAYRDGRPWLNEALQYIYDNYVYLKEQLAQHLPKARILDLKATYLAFIDFNYLNLDDASLDRLFFEEIGIALDSGHWFGPSGSGFMRMNLATPRQNIEEAVQRILDKLN